MGIVAMIVTGLLSLVSVFFGGKLVKYKRLSKEAIELIVVLYNSLKDNKLTPEEIKRIKSELDDVIKVLKDKN